MQTTITRSDSSSPLYQPVWELREEILRKPLGMSLKNEDLSRDHEDVILVAQDGGNVIGCLMLHHVDSGQLQMRQMAVYNEWQGKGIGRLLVQAAEVYAAEKGYSKIVLHARKVALGFYEVLGYTAHGDEFSEVGIPHYMMEKQVAALV
jgi:predicted N-acetyltransferase YhbS